MDFEKTQPLASDTRHYYRCPCGVDVQVDPERGGQCSECERVIPASATRQQLSLTMTMSKVTGSFELTRPDDMTSDDNAPCMSGQQLGHFKVLEPIGQGGMGQVYRALDTSLQRYVAVKVIQASVTGNLDTRGEQQLMREAIAQARVNHPNIVTIYYVGRESEMPFLAMELIDGQDVSQLIKSETLSYERLASIAMQITHALDIASQMGIVHGDIKPQNLLVLSNGDVKLSDFGMARLTDGDEDASVGGTPNYLAPELLKGGKPSIQSDMYALGVTLYELTFRALPVSLSGSSVAGWSEIHANASIAFPEPWPDHLPIGWKSILEKLLHKNPDKRFESYKDLGHEIFKQLPTHRATARPLPRLIAFAIDIVTVILLLAPLGIVSRLINNFISIPLINAFLSVAYLIGAILIYLAMVYVWRQTIGRELLDIRVINQYGLTPGRRKMVVRSLLRMSLVWAILIGIALQHFIPYAFITNFVLGMLFFTVDSLFVAFVSKGRSLHDIIVNTHVVSGTQVK